MLTNKGHEKKAKQKLDVTVLSAPRQNLEPVSCLKEPKTEKVNFCGCFNKGVMSFGMNVVDSQVGKGEQISFQASCVNDTTVEITEVLALLTESIEWEAGGRENRAERILRQEDITSKCGDMASLSSNEEKDEFDKEACYKEILQNITDGNNIVTLNIPSVSNCCNKMDFCSVRAAFFPLNNDHTLIHPFKIECT